MFKHLIPGVALASLLALPAAAIAQATYPAKPIRLLIPYAPGGGTDLVTRPVTQKLSEIFKQQILFDNRGGGFGIIATEVVARAPADGYTLLMGTTATMTVNPVLFEKVPFDSVKDFSPITILGLAPNVLAASTKFPPNNFQQLIAYAKANPGKVNYASSGSGTSVLYLEMIQQMAGVKMLFVPYKGTGPTLTAILAGEVDITFGAAGVFLPGVKDGRVKLLAAGSLERLPNLPDIPTINESGMPGFESASWYGMLAPAGTPRPIVNLLYGEISKILKSPDIASRYLAAGAFPVGNSPESFAERIRTETERWGKVAKAAGIKPQSF
jgi:tripartite-type tricarboxylate transporter receptor subunit TctC